LNATVIHANAINKLQMQLQPNSTRTQTGTESGAAYGKMRGLSPTILLFATHFKIVCKNAEAVSWHLASRLKLGNAQLFILYTVYRA